MDRKMIEWKREDRGSREKEKQNWNEQIENVKEKS